MKPAGHGTNRQFWCDSQERNHYEDQRIILNLILEKYDWVTFLRAGISDGLLCSGQCEILERLVVSKELSSVELVTPMSSIKKSSKRSMLLHGLRRLIADIPTLFKK
jgi:hypothetical protein